MGKNKTIPSGERTIILRVLHYFEEEKRKCSPLLPLKNAIGRASTATGVSLSTITRIKREERKILQEMSSSTEPGLNFEQASSSSLVPNSRPNIILPTPGKTRRSSANKLVIDDFMINSIKEIVNNFYKEKNELPTLNKILAVAKADLNFPGHKETLRKILREKCGYTFTKCMKSCIRKKNLLKGNEVGFWRARNTKQKRKKVNIEENAINNKNDNNKGIKEAESLLDNTNQVKVECGEIKNLQSEHNRFSSTESNKCINTQNDIYTTSYEHSEFSKAGLEMNKVEKEHKILSNVKNEEHGNHMGYVGIQVPMVKY